jgi:TonB-dependent Receptor Plug Domain/CarboxypepD_reg-like domain
MENSLFLMIQNYIQFVTRQIIVHRTSPPNPLLLRGEKFDDKCSPLSRRGVGGQVLWKIIYSSMILLLLNIKTSAQNTQRSFMLEGIIVDSLTSKPLVGASVKIDFKKGIKTDSQGRFSFLCDTGKEYAFGVSYVGFRNYNKKTVFTENVLFRIALSEISKELEEVSVSGGGYQKNIRNLQVGVQQLSIKQLQKLPAAMGEIDILRGLQTLPGVTSVGEGSNGINIRGGSTDQNLMVFDEAPIFNPTHLFGLFSAIPQESISSLELYKGAIPAHFGGRVASVVDIGMRNPDLEHFKMSGGIGLVSSRLAMDIPLQKEKMGIMLASRASFNDFLLKTSADLANKKANFIELASKFYWRLGKKDVISWSVFTTKDYTKLDGISLNKENSGALITEIRYNVLNSTLRWTHRFSDKLNFQAVGVFSDYSPSLTSPDSVLFSKVESEIHYRKYGASLNYLPNDNHQIEVGLNLITYRINPGKRTDNDVVIVNLPEEKSNEIAVYAEDNITVSKKFSISVGLRALYFQNIGNATVRLYKDGEIRSENTVTSEKQYGAGESYNSYSGLEPRLGMRFLMTENSSLKLGANIMRQYIQIITNSLTPLPTSRWKTSDATLKPQVSSLISLGYFQNFKDNIYEISSEVYFRHTDNITDVRPGGDFLLKNFVETELIQGTNRSYGLELMVSKKKGTTTGWLNYTYARSENQIKGRGFFDEVNNGNLYPTSYDRPHSLNANISISPTKTHTFSFAFAYATGRPYSKPDGLVNLEGRVYPIYLSRNLDRIPDYHRLDFSWTIKNPSLKKRDWEGSWTFTVFNLYNYQNAYSIFFRNDRGSTQSYKLSVFAAAIPSLTYNFKFK